MKRVITAAVLLLVVWVVCRHASPSVFALVVGLFTAGTAWECLGLLEACGARPFRLLGTLAALVACWSFSRSAPAWLDPSMALVATAGAVSAVAMGRRATTLEMLHAATSTVFTVVLVGLGLGSLVGIRLSSGSRGADLILLLVLCVVASDSAAFYVGRALGRARLAPVVSPGKTWAGLWAGLAASVAAAMAGGATFFQDLPTLHAGALGALLGVAGVLGDLAESTIKRAAGAKDASALLPGHGGLFDRVDSILFAAPVLYGYSRAFLGGPS